MKRKPNKPRPEAQTHTEPGNGAAEPGGSAFGAGSEQEPRAAGTSGQSVPKSKFRQKSQQEQAAASKLRMEKRGEKREAAREKLAKQKPPKQKGPIRKAAGAAGWGVHGFVHGKLYEVEQENVGTEGAHRSELAGEVVLRHGSQFVKRKVREHPARAAGEGGRKTGSQSRRENSRRHGKADSPGRRVCEAPSSRMPAGAGLCPCDRPAPVLFVLAGVHRQRRSRGAGSHHLPL